MCDMETSSDYSLTDDESTASVKTKKKRRTPSELNPVVLSKSHLLQAIETILQPKDKCVGRQLKISTTYNGRHDVLTRVNTYCADRSHLLDYCNRYSFKRTLVNSLRPIFEEMRLCLLACDWDNYKELLIILFRSSNVKAEFLMFCIRSCFILLLNHPNRTPEMLDNFMASCLGINDESRRLQYLKDCFLLKNYSTSILNKNNLDEDDEEEEEEEMFFDSSFSSD